MDQNELTQDADVTELDELESISENEEKIERRRLRPLSSFLEFDVSHRPTQAKDRVAKKRVYMGIALGIILIALGLIGNFKGSEFSLFGMAEELPETTVHRTFSAAWLFVGLGLFLIFTRLLLMFYGRDFFIGHKFAAVVIQKPFEHSNRMADSLDGYIGVRYRSRIVNFWGLTSFTQHIIDLQHPNEAKTIPLYISNEGNGAAKKWEEYARQLQMPAIFNTADGIIEIPPEDIQKSLPTLIKEGKINIDDRNLYKVPPSFKIVEDADSCQVDPQIRDSAFSLFSAVVCICAFFSIAFFGFILSTRIPSFTIFSYLPMVIITTFLFVLVPTSLFFRKKRLIVTRNGIRIKSRWIFFPSFGFLIPSEKIESINVIHNSYDFKYSLVIGADGQTTHIGRGLPKEDLDWLHNFINAQVRRFICTENQKAA